MRTIETSRTKENFWSKLHGKTKTLSYKYYQYRIYILGYIINSMTPPTKD